MKRFTVSCVALVLAAGSLLQVETGSAIGNESLAGIMGGACTLKAEDYTNCYRAVTGDDQNSGCKKCFVRRKCTATNIDEVCTPAGGSSAEDSIKCGVCKEDCGGAENEWSNDDCTGDILNVRTCDRQWSNAQHRLSGVACP